jgi:hypothetical protein
VFVWPRERVVVVAVVDSNEKWNCNVSHNHIFKYKKNIQ